MPSWSDPIRFDLLSPTLFYTIVLGQRYAWTPRSCRDCFKSARSFSRYRTAGSVPYMSKTAAAILIMKHWQNCNRILTRKFDISLLKRPISFSPVTFFVIQKIKRSWCIKWREFEVGCIWKGEQSSGSEKLINYGKTIFLKGAGCQRFQWAAQWKWSKVRPNGNDTNRKPLDVSGQWEERQFFLHVSSR